ncbi:protein APEM9-like [Bidens hawaiensis]|uniref:protein APEM9-like n=1 Tax=Bidens hawaiensis TaxID=980011 RepID=UPI00404B70DB
MMADELGFETQTSVVNQQPIIDIDVEINRLIWEEIELAESYLVCSMFEEASSSASRVLNRLHDKDCSNEVVEDELNDMLESAGMVFLQSFKELGRTLEIINELTRLYGSLVAIPVQVFLAGACFQMQEDPHGAQKSLEGYLSKWEYVNGQYYVQERVDTNESSLKDVSSRFVLGVDVYIQVVEAYITLQTGILRGTDHVIAWVEKAALPEHTRQELLRRLQSMNSSKDTGSQASTSALLTDGSETSVSLKKEGRGDAAAKKAILRYSCQNVSTFWWFRKLNLKIGGVRFAVSNGSIVLTALLLFVYYYMRRKKYTITSILKGQAQFVKKTVIDLWQLAFSYQVNPLAAVETLQTPNRVSR